MDERRGGPTRRNVLAAGAGALMLPLGGRAAHAATGSGEDGIYHAPGGRIGLRKPAGIDAWNDSWILASQDGTLNVYIREGLRFARRYGNPLWDQYGQQKLPTPSREVAGFEAVEYRDPNYDGSEDYQSRTLVLRDDVWIGAVNAVNSNLGGQNMVPGGQNARWRETVDAVLASVVVRPAPTPEAAMTELGVHLDAKDLNPRVVGGTLILSLYEPRGQIELWGANHPVIRTTPLTALPLGEARDRTADIDQYRPTALKSGKFDFLEGPHCRAVVWPEMNVLPDLFTTKLDCFSPTRHVEFTALYDARNREPLLKALTGLLDTLELRDPA